MFLAYLTLLLNSQALMFIIGCEAFIDFSSRLDAWFFNDFLIAVCRVEGK